MDRQDEKKLQDYRRIEQAIHYIGGRVRAQPNLAEVAAHVGLSPYHFQRLFRRWAGVSPKRFLEYLTVEQAKRLLAQSESVLSTSHQVGLSGPARLHDHFVSIEAVTPGEFKRRGLDLEIRHGVAASPFGPVLVAGTSRGLCALSFVDAGGEETELTVVRGTWPEARLRRDDVYARNLVRKVFVSTDRARQHFPLWVRGTNYQIKVWNALLRIPPGAMATYRQIAEAIGHPRAARSVATAIGANPVGFLIPCHRVIRADGALGGYRWGETRKATLLGWEQAATEQEEPAILLPDPPLTS